jgi:molybdopterin converting factor small subunit
MIKISVRSNFAGMKRKTGDLLLQEENSNLMSALSAIEADIKVKLVNTDLGEIYPDIEVTVNGVDSNFLPEKLSTKLKESDTLGISFITMGGG